MKPARKLILEHARAPGDHVVLTALPRDIQAAFPGQFLIDVQSRYKDIWANNPHLTPLQGQTGVERIKIDYGFGLKEQKRETVHFLSYFHRDFFKKTRLKVPLTLPYPDLHLSKDEQEERLVAEPYWLFLSGGKPDVTVKIWDPVYWQETIDRLRGHGLRFVQVGDAQHRHPEIKGVLNLVGQTSLRDLMRLVAQAEGVICGLTCCMHMAAAFQKPCVVLAGGREAWHWSAYVPENRGLGGEAVAQKLRMPHRFLHASGLLDCALHGGCWVNKSIKERDDPLICKQPVILPGRAVPRCLRMITPAMVETAVLSFYLDGSIKPLETMDLSQLQ